MQIASCNNDRDTVIKVIIQMAASVGLDFVGCQIWPRTSFASWFSVSVSNLVQITCNSDWVMAISVSLF